MATTPRRRAPRSERRDRRGVKRALIVLAVLLVVLLVRSRGAFVGYLGYTVNDNVTHEAPAPENRPPVTAPDGTEVKETGTGTNFLVMGTDTRPGDAGRSDVIVLVHIPEDGKTVSMIHFPRDLYVEHPGARQGQDQRRLRLRPRAAPRARRSRTCSRSASTTSPRPTSRASRT